MKKVFLIIMTILLIPVLVNAETCDNDKVYIDSISIDKNNNVEEIGQATANGKNINLTLGVSNVGDNIRYKIVVKNDSNEDYVVDKNSINISSKYMDYTIESDNSNVVKARSSKTILFLKSPGDLNRTTNFSPFIIFSIASSTDKDRHLA